MAEVPEPLHFLLGAKPAFATLLDSHNPLATKRLNHPVEAAFTLPIAWHMSHLKTAIETRFIHSWESWTVLRFDVGLKPFVSNLYEFVGRPLSQVLHGKLGTRAGGLGVTAHLTVCAESISRKL